MVERHGAASQFHDRLESSPPSSGSSRPVRSLMIIFGLTSSRPCHLLNLGYALSPLLIGFMAIPALKHTGNRYLLNLVGVLLWPLGWALAALVTQGILDFMTDPSFEYIDPTSTLPEFPEDHRRRCRRLLAIIFSTVALPVHHSEPSSPTASSPAARCSRAVSAARSKPPPPLPVLPAANRFGHRHSRRPPLARHGGNPRC